MHQNEKTIHKGDKVKIVHLADDVDDLRREYISCFLGWVGVVKTEPQWHYPDPAKGPLGKIIARGECWVEFDQPCRRHGDTGAVFEVSELKKVEG